MLEWNRRHKAEIIAVVLACISGEPYSQDMTGFWEDLRAIITEFGIQGVHVVNAGDVVLIEE